MNSAPELLNASSEDRPTQTQGAPANCGSNEGRIVVRNVKIRAVRTIQLENAVAAARDEALYSDLGRGYDAQVMMGMAMLIAHRYPFELDDHGVARVPQDVRDVLDGMYMPVGTFPGVWDPVSSDAVVARIEEWYKYHPMELKYYELTNHSRRVWPATSEVPTEGESSTAEDTESSAGETLGSQDTEPDSESDEGTLVDEDESAYDSSFIDDGSIESASTLATESDVATQIDEPFESIAAPSPASVGSFPPSTPQGGWFQTPLVRRNLGREFDAAAAHLARFPQPPRAPAMKRPRSVEVIDLTYDSDSD